MSWYFQFLFLSKQFKGKCVNYSQISMTVYTAWKLQAGGSLGHYCHGVGEILGLGQLCIHKIFSGDTFSVAQRIRAIPVTTERMKMPIMRTHGVWILLENHLRCLSHSQTLCEKLKVKWCCSVDCFKYPSILMMDGGVASWVGVCIWHSWLITW